MRARENPFAVDRILKVRYQPLKMSWDQIIEDLVRLNYRAAVVGPEGSGKTTLLEDLEQRLNRRGFLSASLRINEGQRSIPQSALQEFFAPLDGRHIVYADGVEQLSLLSWLSFKRRTRTLGGLVITTHREGRLPTLIYCDTTPQVLEDILAQLLGHDLVRVQDSIEDMFQKHRGNIREILRDYYDVFAAGG